MRKILYAHTYSITYLNTIDVRSIYPSIYKIYKNCITNVLAYSTKLLTHNICSLLPREFDLTFEQELIPS